MQSQSRSKPTIYIAPDCPPDVERHVRQTNRGARIMGRSLMVTHTADGPAYGTDTGKAVSSKQAAEMQADLFVTPQEDGLFPGFSQTWKREG